MPFLKRLSLAASGLALGLLAVSQPAAAQAANVVTTGGAVEGRALASGVVSYMGIPYAAPPVRELRWRDPQPAPRWEGVFHADRAGPQCMQPQRAVLTNQYSGAEVTSEDCLYLNVWTKPNLKKAPVIVFVHGGGFFIGSGGMPLYGGEGVAAKDAVFVNFNYRLGTLGFLAHPELSAESPHKTSGNYAFMDQVAALRWVRDNIAQFGGDPDNVTIAGQSAGSMAVLTLQASPLAKGLFHRVVGMSGATLNPSGPGRLRTLSVAEQDGLKFQGLTKAKSLADLRALPADALFVPRTPGGPSVGPIQDGYVLPDQVEAIFARKAQSDVPLIVGFTRDESFGGFGAINGLEDYRAKAAARFGERTPAFMALYPASTDAEAVRQARAADRDSTMASGMNAWARMQTAHGRAPVFSYEFARPHAYPAEVVITDLDPATAGGYHTSEVPFWLGSLESFNRFRPLRAWTQADRDFSSRMTESLVAFARSGSPNTASLTWPAYKTRNERLLELGAGVQAAPWPSQAKLTFFASAPRPAITGTGPLRD